MKASIITFMFIIFSTILLTLKKVKLLCQLDNAYVYDTSYNRNYLHVLYLFTQEKMNKNTMNIIIVILLMVQILICHTYTNSFSKTKQQRIDINYAIIQNRVINKDNTVKSQQSQENIYDINDIKISLLSKNEIESASEMVCNVHYEPNIYIKIIKNMIKNRTTKQKEYYYYNWLNNWLDKKIIENKEKLRQQITDSFSRRSGERLTSFDLNPTQSSVIIVAKNQINEIIGLIEIWPRPFDDKKSTVAYICNLSVKKENRNQGIGSELCDAAEKLCFEWGKDSIMLSVDYNNYVAKQFYSRRNFVDQYSGINIHHYHLNYCYHHNNHYQHRY